MAYTSTITPLPSCQPFPPFWQGAAQSTLQTSFFLLYCFIRSLPKHPLIYSRSRSVLTFVSISPPYHHTFTLFLGVTSHSPWAPRSLLTSSMPCPMSVFRSCMLWFYKRKGKEKVVHVLQSACMSVSDRRFERLSRGVVCLSSGMYRLGGAVYGVLSSDTSVCWGSRMIQSCNRPV